MSTKAKFIVGMCIWLGVALLFDDSLWVVGLILLGLTLLWLIGQKSETPAPAPKPPEDVRSAFSFSPEDGEAPADIRFDASESRSGGGAIASYTWQFGDGKKKETEKPTTRHRYAEAGTFEVRLTVRDSLGRTAVATHAVQLRPASAPEAPTEVVATAAPAAVVVSWDAVPGATSYVLHWSRRKKKEEEPERLEEVTSPYRHEGLSPGKEYRYAVSAIGDGGEGPLSEWVEATPEEVPVQAPVAEFQASPLEGTAPLVVTLDGSGSRAEGEITSYGWDFGDGQQGAGARVVHAYALPGEYTAELRVTDDRDATATARRQISVRAAAALSAPTGLVATAGRGEVSLHWDSVPKATSYVVVWATGAAAELSAGTRVPSAASPFSHRGLSPGQVYSYWVIAVDAREEGPASVRATATPAAANAPPVAAFSQQLAPDSPLRVAFDATGSMSPEGLPLTFTWSFGDGATGTGPTVAHAYTAGGSYPVTLTVTDRNGGSGSARQLVHVHERALPPAPATVAPPLDGGVSHDLSDSTGFLLEGPNPIQKDVAPGAIDRRRAAVLRGRVLQPDGSPAPGVRIQVAGEPRLGSTLSRADGLFDLVVNGGGPVSISYDRRGFLPVRRDVDAPWGQYSWLPDVVLRTLDSAVTVVVPGAGGGQVARGAVVKDGDGERQASVLFPEAVTATARLPDGRRVPLPRLSVRATEYTVGAQGPNAMPYPLPAGSGYTYAVELSVDEAHELGASSVEFSAPVIHYVENFLDFPVGGVVPAGRFDAERGAWVPSANGRVIRVLGIRDGLADVDVDGSGKPAAEDALTGLGFGREERARLGSLYRAGQSLWRVPLPSFSPWDFNWPYGPPKDARPPSPKPPRGDEPDPDSPVECGSVVDIQNQALGEIASVEGTPFLLHYMSNRVPGRRAAYTLEVPAAADDMPASVKGMDVEVQIAGQRHAWALDRASPSPVFTWDGKDAYQRTMQGTQQARVRVGWRYDAVYQRPAELERSFAQLSGVPMDKNTARQQVTMWQERLVRLGTWNALGLGMGGWTLNVHHCFDPQARILYLGDGTHRVGRDLASLVNSVAGSGEPGAKGLGKLASQVQLQRPTGIGLTADGTLYIADTDNHRILRVERDGRVTLVAGTGKQGFSGDEGPATQAQLNSPDDFGLGADGSVYIADNGNNRVRRVWPDGRITTVAGTGKQGFAGDGGPATHAQLSSPTAVVVATDGSWYVAEIGNRRIRKVGPDGIITTVAGTGEFGSAGDGGRATEAQLKQPVDVALYPDGSFLIVDSEGHCIRRVGPDGIISTVVGTGEAGYSGDGGPALKAELREPIDVIVAADGCWYIADGRNHCIRRVGPDGVITTVVGSGERGGGGDGGPGLGAELDLPSEILFGPDGSLYIADSGNHRIRKVTPSMAGVALGEIVLPSPDGQTLHRFDARGRHQSTCDTLTGAVRYAFSYDTTGRLAGVTDGAGRQTGVERAADGGSVTLVAPSGKRTTLQLGPDGFAASISHGQERVLALRYAQGGLLKELTNARGATSRFTYDELGRLRRDEPASGRWRELTRVPSAGDIREVSVRNAEERVKRYRLERLTTGGTRRVETCCGGGDRVEEVSPDGVTTVVQADGTRITSRQQPDPRFGMEAPLLAEETITTPAGRKLVTRLRRTVELARPGDPLSLRSLVDELETNGLVSSTRYDAARRELLKESAEGRISRTRMDEHGRVVESQELDLPPTTFSYDDRGRLVRVAQGARHLRRTFDGSGRLESITDALERPLRLLYDEAGRGAGLVAADGRTTRYARNAHGELVAVTPPGRPAHQFHRGPTGRLEAYEAPAIDGPCVTRYKYDRDGVLAEISYPGGKTLSYEYDDAERLVAMVVPEGRIQLVPDKATGHLARLIAVDGTALAYAYDGELITGLSWTGAVQGKVTLGYDDAMRLSSVAVGSGPAVALTYDGDGLRTQAGELMLNREPGSGRLAGTELGGVRDECTYELGELSRYTVTARNEPLYQLELKRDELGRIREKHETVAGATHRHEYAYDAAGQLRSIRRDDALVAEYTYDENGAPLRSKVGEREVECLADAQDRLVRAGDVTFTYTPNGERESRSQGDARTLYVHDLFGNLKSVRLPDGRTVEYCVDATQRRIGRKVNGKLVQGLLYAPGLGPVAELDETGAVRTRFVYGVQSHVPDYFVREGATYRIVHDHLGSPRLVVNVETGEIAQRLEYDALGNVLEDTHPGFQPFGYAGGLYDPETRLVRLGAREYDPATGTWLTKDPSGFASGDVNLYRYAGNDPVNWVDTSGERARPSGYPYNQDDPIVWNILDIHLKAQAVQEAYFPRCGDPLLGQFRHCVATCLLTRWWSPVVSVSAKIWSNTFWEGNEDSPLDQEAEWYGLQNSLQPKTCGDVCADRYPPHYCGQNGSDPPDVRKKTEKQLRDLAH